MNENSFFQINDLLGQIGRELTDVQIEQFDRFNRLLLDWNERINLTAVRTTTGVEQTHFVDSVSTILGFGSLENHSLIDVGSGAGLPGIPLKIIFPTLKLTLVESVGKKTSFLGTAVHELNLDNVTILNDRAENVGRDTAHRAQYDWATARAVAELNVLLEYLAPLCQLNGRMLILKGPDAEKEIKAAEKAQAELYVQLEGKQTVPQSLTDEKVRKLLTFRKVATTPERYPRRAGIPTKRPL